MHYFQSSRPLNPSPADDDSIMCNDTSILSHNSSRCLSPNTRRSAGTFRGQYKLKLFEKPTQINQKVGSEYRTSNGSYLRNLEESHMYPPGPGTYNLRAPVSSVLPTSSSQYQGNSPVPLGSFRYTPNRILPTASFRSSSPSRPSHDKHRSFLAPGPAYYKSKEPNFKVTCRNVDNKWV
jgi:hypothetical protein